MQHVEPATSPLMVGTAPTRGARVARAVCTLLAVIAVLWGCEYLLRQFIRAKTFQLMGGLVYRVETDEKAVALTFDDGPEPGPTAEILAILRQERARATFYLVGRDVERNLDAARAIVTAGHEVGNHSFTHQRMVFCTPGFVNSEVEETDAAIRRAGYAGPILFRPPYGRKLFVLPYVLSRTGRRTVTWDVEAGEEARKQPLPSRIAREILRKARPGSIILLHPMAAHRGPTRAALPLVIRGLHARGYRLATVSELLALPQRAR